MKNKKNKDRPKILVDLSIEEYKLLAEIAKSEDRSRTGCARNAIKEYIADFQMKKKKPQE